MNLLEQEYYQNLNKIRNKKYNNTEKIIINGKNWHNFAIKHFVHTMEYFYYASDVILNNKKSFIIIIEPPTDYKSAFVVDFIKMLYKKIDNFIFTKKYENKNSKILIFEHDKYKKSDNFLIKNNNNFIEKKWIYYDWFPYRKSSLLRDLFLKKNNNKDIKIGLINRRPESRRFLKNFKDIVENIYKKFKLKVDVTYFEDKKFEEQIKFYNDHNIIISPHGAQLCGIPFLQDNGLIIECCHDEWHPYYYFPGLSYSSSKYHVMLCDKHSPSFSSGNIKGANRKSNIRTNINQILEIIEIYLRKRRLDKNNCYLY